MFFELAVENYFTDILQGNALVEESEDGEISLPSFEKVNFDSAVFDPFNLGLS